MNAISREEIALYLKSAREALAVSQLNIENEFCTAAINRAYYAVFYAASALLVSRQIAHAKHSAVIAAFRQHFVKTGLLPVEMSEIYGHILEDRHESDYELLSNLTIEDARKDLQMAVYFVNTIKELLRSENWL